MNDSRSPLDPSPYDPSSSPRSDDANDSGLDRLLTEAAIAERRATPVDADRFLTRLRVRLTPFSHRPGLGRALAVAAMLPIALGLGLMFGAPGSGPNTTPELRGEELALIEELDVLLILDELSPDEVAEIDPDLLDLYLNLEIIEELPVEILGKS
jgi:hypothetical protein